MHQLAFEQFALVDLALQRRAGLGQRLGTACDPLFQFVVGDHQGAVDPVDLAEAAQQPHRHVQQQQDQQGGEHQQIQVVALVDQDCRTLVAVEHHGNGIQVPCDWHCPDLLKQLIDLGLLAQDQRNVVAEGVDGRMERQRQALFVDRQLVQTDEYVGCLVIRGHLGEFQAAEHQVVGVGRNGVQA
ncbi:hypothetical protein D3C81_710010 [compost metagenome]